MGLGDQERREYLLRIWCAQPKPGAAHGSSERFAMVVGPAIERWLQANIDQVTPAQTPSESKARTSGDQPTRSSGDIPRPRLS
jgi:hypothetical protein